MQTIIITAVTLFMVIMFLVNKIPFGVTTMTCLMLYVLTGVIDVDTAFSGLVNQNTILLAGVLALSDALAKTSLVGRLRDYMRVMKSKGGYVLIGLLFIFTIVISQFMSLVATVSVMMLFLQSLDNNDELSPARMIFPILGVSTVWCNKFPIGIGAAYPSMTNSFYQGITDGQYLLSLWDLFKGTLVPGIALTVYCVFAWKLIPQRSIDLSKLANVNGQGKTELTHTQEIIRNCHKITVSFWNRSDNIIPLSKRL